MEKIELKKLGFIKKEKRYAKNIKTFDENLKDVLSIKQKKILINWKYYNKDNNTLTISKRLLRLIPELSNYFGRKLDVNTLKLLPIPYITYSINIKYDGWTLDAALKDAKSNKDYKSYRTLKKIPSFRME